MLELALAELSIWNCVETVSAFTRDACLVGRPNVYAIQSNKHVLCPGTRRLPFTKKQLGTFAKVARYPVLPDPR